MKTKNKKRIGAVPISLVTAFTLATFLSVGLLLTANGPPTAEAQSADCKVMVDKAGIAAILPTDRCSVQGDTATVEFMGAADATDDVTLSLLIEDAAGPITAYPNGTTWNDGNTQLEKETEAATAMRYRFQSITIPKAKANSVTGIVEGQKVSVMVKGNVHVWTGGVSVTSVIDLIPSDSAFAGAREVAADSSKVKITFLGNPAIGQDSDKDSNTIVDDAMQCEKTDDNAVKMELPEDGICPSGYEFDTGDMPESRSTLKSGVGESDITVREMLLDGGSAEHLLGKTEMEVIIVAHVQDAKGQVLGDVPVTFTATSEPADIESSIRTVDTEDDEEDKEHGNAQRKISGLPLSGTYRVTVAVSADGVDLGSIVIVRPGNLDSVMATACFDDAKNKADDDGCGMGRRPQSVFKRGDSFVIVAQAKDALGTVIMPDKSSVEIPADAADSFGAPMADAEKKVFTIAIEDDAMSGVYNLTVKAEQNLANSTMLTETAMVSVTISGDLTQYAVTGPSRIPAGRIETYTVSALDANGAPATIKTTGDGKNDKVTVLVTGSGASDIRVLDLGANEKTLADDGTSTFRIFAPPNAPDSEIIITIIGVMGTETVTKQVNIGDNRAPMAVGTLEAITLAPGATQDVDVADAFSDSDGDMLVYTAMATPEGLTVTVAGSVITLTAGEANAMVTVTVMATDPSGAGAAQSLMVSVAPNDLLTSPDNVEATADDTTITVTWTPGVNASRGHLVLLFSTPDFELVQFADPTVSGTHTFTGLDPGTYVAVVVSIRQMSEYLYEFVLVTVLAPAAAAM